MTRGWLGGQVLQESVLRVVSRSALVAAAADCLLHQHAVAFHPRLAARYAPKRPRVFEDFVGYYTSIYAATNCLGSVLVGFLTERLSRAGWNVFRRGWSRFWAVRF